MSKNKKSDVWEFFDRNDAKSSTCKICKQVINNKSNTSNLRDHLVRRHKEKYIACKNKAGGSPTDGDGEPDAGPSKPKQRKLSDFTSKCYPESYVHGSIKKKELDSALIKMITTDLEPFHIVNKPGFVQFVKTLDPRYSLPARRTISEVMLPDLYIRPKEKLMSILENIDYISCTSDMWTSLSGDSYLTLTLHFVLDWELKSAVLTTKKVVERHTSENISKEILSILNEFNLANKLVCLVTDNASNMAKAGTILNTKHIGCFAHTLQLVITDALGITDVKPLISKTKEIVTTFKTSNVAGEILKAEQKRLSKPPLKLIQEVPTRWNSTFHMIQRILNIGEPLVIAISKLEKSKISYFTAEEVLILKDLVQLLAAFNEATETISGENYATSSLVIPIAYCLKHNMDQLSKEMKTETGKLVHAVIVEGIIRRLVPYERRTTTQLATILDPHWKKTPFLNTENAESAQKALENAVSHHLKRMAEIDGNNEQAPTTHEPESEERNEKEPGKLFSLFSILEKKKEAAKTQRTNSADSIITVRQYLQGLAIPKKDKTNVFHYWRDTNFTTLQQLAKKYLSVPATSVSAERIFSKAGQIINENRSRLNPTKADMQVFLKTNMWVLDE